MYSWRVVGRVLRRIIYAGRISRDDFGRLQQGDGSAALAGERVPGGEIGQESEDVDAAVRIDADDQKKVDEQIGDLGGRLAGKYLAELFVGNGKIARLVARAATSWTCSSALRLNSLKRVATSWRRELSVPGLINMRPPTQLRTFGGRKGISSKRRMALRPCRGKGATLR